MVNDNETIGMRIKKQRLMLGMTQEEMGEVLCIPKATISAYENDNIDFKASRLNECCWHRSAWRRKCQNRPS